MTTEGATDAATDAAIGRSGFLTGGGTTTGGGTGVLKNKSHMLIIYMGYLGKIRMKALQHSGE